jgi:large subunit ribosomal protein L30
MKKLKITLVKSTNGCLEKQKKTVEALGLKKIRSTTVKDDNPAIRGMIFVVKHLVTVEEVEVEA